MKNILKSTGAILAGFFSVAILSTVTDLILEALKIMPSGLEVYKTGGTYVSFMLLVALIYRGAFGVLGSYIAASLAPNRPMFHAMLLGWIGFFFAGLGAYVNFDKAGPATWYPILLVIITPPCAWLGGKLQSNTAKK